MAEDLLCVSLQAVALLLRGGLCQAHLLRLFGRPRLLLARDHLAVLRGPEVRLILLGLEEQVGLLLLEFRRALDGLFLFGEHLAEGEPAVELEGTAVEDDLLLPAGGGLVVEAHAELAEHFVIGETGLASGLLRLQLGAHQPLHPLLLLPLHYICS